MDQVYVRVREPIAGEHRSALVALGAKASSFRCQRADTFPASKALTVQ
ncbi:hypothetical protein SAMN05443551_1850 [Marivita hallyeonensis]|uniref:Uncharacterized protein n=1 Tax=Marivita hallyeonensis TaxID=996342 RepID=A0A1M5RR65_9RHOB|nr:hypothetical protein SAMN05443551_1850 [Marivita hallyeonensis]